MRISRVKISNFRSIREITIECSPHLVLLGPNNHGKSNVLAAIEFALNSAKPNTADFFRCNEDWSNNMWVELTFSELTDQERTTFKKYVRRDGSFTVRKEATKTDDAVVTEYHGFVEEPQEWWLKPSSADELTNGERLQELAKTIPELAPLSQKKGRITKADVEKVQQAYIEAHRVDLVFEQCLETDNFLGPKNIAAGVLPEFYLIPAVRDLSDETKIKAGTSLGRLVQRAVKEMAENDANLTQAQAQLEKAVVTLSPPRGDPQRANTAIGRLEAEVSTELKDWGCDVAIDVLPPSVDRLFELGTELRLDDGVETPAEDKGHGLQRATLFALVRVWSRILQAAACNGGPAPRKASESLVFAVEEPELFLHPHAQRQFDAALRKLAEKDNHQVLLATHSTHFVNLDHYKEICIITRENPAEGSRARQCSGDLFQGDDARNAKSRFHMASWVNPDRAEMLFARRVVLVEGETEKALLPYLASRLSVFDPAVSIIDCAGKNNLPLYVDICKAFGLDYCVVHDEDPVPPDCPDTELASRKRAYALNRTIADLCGDETRIYVFSPDFERACDISKSKIEKKGKSLAALDYFSELANEAFPQCAVDCTNMAYGRTRSVEDEKGEA